MGEDMTLTFPNFKKEVENIFGRLDPWNILGRSDPWNSYKACKDLTTKWQALIQKAQETCGLYYQTKLHLQWGATTENQWVRDTIWFRVKDAKNLILSAKEKTPKLMPKPCYSKLADSDISKLMDFRDSNWGKLITVIQLYTERHYALLPHPQRESSLSQELNILSFKEKRHYTNYYRLSKRPTSSGSRRKGCRSANPKRYRETLRSSPKKRERNLLI